MLTKRNIFKIFIGLSLQFTILNICTAQWYDPEKVNKKAGDIYGQAYEQATSGNYPLAIQLIKQSLDKRNTKKVMLI